MGGNIAMITNEVATVKDSGFELAALVGGEFFLNGLDSLGFTFETGVGVTNVKKVRFKTVGEIGNLPNGTYGLPMDNNFPVVDAVIQPDTLVQFTTSPEQHALQSMMPWRIRAHAIPPPASPARCRIRAAACQTASIKAKATPLGSPGCRVTRRCGLRFPFPPTSHATACPTSLMAM